MRELQTEVRGRVRLSASRAYGRIRLLPLVARLVAEHPHLDVDLILDARRLDFIEDDLDLALREGPLAGLLVDVRKLGDVAVRLFAAPALSRAPAGAAQPRGPRAPRPLAVPASGPASDVGALRGRDGRRLGLVPRSA